MTSGRPSPRPRRFSAAPPWAAVNPADGSRSAAAEGRAALIEERLARLLGILAGERRPDVLELVANELLEIAAAGPFHEAPLGVAQGDRRALAEELAVLTEA